MKLKFRNDLEDAEALAAFHYRMSPTLKKSRRNVQIVSALLIPIFAILGFFDKFNVETIVLSVVLIGWLIFVGFHHRRSFIKKSTRIYHEKGGQKAFGDHEMILGENSVEVITDLSRGEIRYQQLAQVVKSDDYSFVYVDDLRALIIPSNKITEGSYEEFTIALRQKYEQYHQVKSTEGRLSADS